MIVKLQVATYVRVRKEISKPESENGELLMHEVTLSNALRLDFVAWHKVHGASCQLLAGPLLWTAITLGRLAG